IHEQSITIALSRSKLAGQIASMGGGIATLMEIALSVMEAVESELPESGTMVSHWHSMRSLAAVSRAAFDPDSTMGIEDRTGVFAGFPLTRLGQWVCNHIPVMWPQIIIFIAPMWCLNGHRLKPGWGFCEIWCLPVIFGIP